MPPLWDSESADQKQLSCCGRLDKLVNRHMSRTLKRWTSEGAAALIIHLKARLSFAHVVKRQTQADYIDTWAESVL
jgi:hypothetical protein